MDIFNNFQTHKIKLKEYLTNNKIYKSNYDCDVCNIPCYSKTIRNYHNDTKNHMQKIKKTK